MIAHALTSEGHDASEDGTGRGTPLAVVAAPLTSGGHPNSNAPGRRKEDDENLVAFHPTQDPINGPIAHALNTEPTGSVAVANGAMVRRLTPTEAMRLQGLPDDWFEGVPGTSDSKMYAGLGDAVTVNVAHWIGARIAESAREGV